jgi:hypothetical protein
MVRYYFFCGDGGGGGAGLLGTDLLTSGRGPVEGVGLGVGVGRCGVGLCFDIFFLLVEVQG